MKIKKILLIILSCFILVGCTNIKNVSYDDIINNLTLAPKKANIHRQGYHFFLPQGMQIKKAGVSYAIISSNNIDYYFYVDLISYNSKDENFVYEKVKNATYSTTINYQNKKGFVNVNLKQNNKYLIEIMYNYAKIEVMVDENKVKETLINSIAILNSIKYDDIIISELLSDDNLDYTEEIFNIFDEIDQDSTFVDNNSNDDLNNSINKKDTDYVN